MIDVLYEHLNELKPFSFANGLIGIGCGMEYLIQNKFVEADSDEILTDIDNLVRHTIDQRAVSQLCLSDGVCGIGCYPYYRLRYRTTAAYDLNTLKLKGYTIYGIDWIAELLHREKNLQTIADAYFLLIRLYKLDLFNAKAEALLACTSAHIIVIEADRARKYQPPLSDKRLQCLFEPDNDAVLHRTCYINLLLKRVNGYSRFL